MTENTANEFFTAKHERLARIAAIANIFAWIVFIVQILFVGGKYIEVQNSFMMQNSFFGESSSFIKMLSEKPLYAASFAVDLASIFLRGVVYGLVLKGISLGLNMIVETDLNYKEKSQGESNE